MAYCVLFFFKKSSLFEKVIIPYAPHDQGNRVKLPVTQTAFFSLKKNPYWIHISLTFLMSILEDFQFIYISLLAYAMGKAVIHLFPHKFSVNNRTDQWRRKRTPNWNKLFSSESLILCQILILADLTHTLSLSLSLSLTHTLSVNQNLVIQIQLNVFVSKLNGQLSLFINQLDRSCHQSPNLFTKAIFAK